MTLGEFKKFVASIPDDDDESLIYLEIKRYKCNF